MDRMKGTFYSEKLFTLFLQESLGIYLSVNGAQSLIGEKENGTRITIVKNKSVFADGILNKPWFSEVFGRNCWVRGTEID
ncbi:hypothetical protein ABIE66_004255 [Peribacillus sp. B2I2]|uniref:hypothetical protein n=1 Tax=unclassified Peribacillus TaxID=2675266 RepID=UPI0025A25DE0|nr:hypothetical protein [Peribacillus sp. ACCC06369]